MRTFLCLLLVFSPLPAAAQLWRQDAANTALVSTTSGGPGQTGLNPAAWWCASCRVVRLSAGQLHELAEMRYGRVSVHLPLGRWGAGAALSSFGYEQYREMAASLQLTRAFHAGSRRTIVSGLRLNYTHTRFGGGYPADRWIGLDLGWSVSPTPFLRLGGVATNVTRPRDRNGTLRPHQLLFEVTLTPAPRWTITASAEHEPARPWSTGAGVSLKLHPAVALLAGAGTEPQRFGGGVALTVGRVTATAAAQLHHALGSTVALELAMRW